MLTITLSNEAATLVFGAKLAKACPPRCLIFLQGELGAGKTTLVRGFLQGLAYKDKVKSPTYTLVETYEIAAQTIFHFDLYRLNTQDELEDIGIRDYLEQTAICFIEWPERGKNLLPAPDLTCYIHSTNAGREIKIISNSDCGHQIIQQLINP